MASRVLLGNVMIGGHFARSGRGYEKITNMNKYGIVWARDLKTKKERAFKAIAGVWHRCDKPAIFK